MDEIARRSALLRGEIVFDEVPPSFAKASVHIYLEDTTLTDASAKVVLHQVVANVAADMVQNERIPFTIDGTIPDTRACYTVRVLVDVDGDGKISHGDYVSTVSYPVLTRGYPDRVVVHVRRVR
jgi:hypothetical protein